MSKDLPQPQQSEEVDLGQLFKLIGNAFDRLFKFIGSIFNKLFLAFVWGVFFVKRHLLKIVIAGIIGVVLGLVKEKTSAPFYSSSAIIKQNYNSGEVLYEAVNYYNKLVTEGDTITLSNDLNIDPSKASSIKSFSIEAVTNDNERIKSYDAYIKNLDSVVASTITYDNYLDFSQEFDIPFQKLDLQSYINESFEEVISSVVNKIKTSPYFLSIQTRDLNELNRRESTLKQTLVKSDSLQAVYQEVLKKSADAKSGGQTSITIDNTEDKSVTKEFELYQNDLVLRRELVEIEREKEEKENIIEIVSTKKGRGTVQDTSDVFGFELSRPIVYALLLSILTFVLLLARDFLKFLERFKEKA
ncbi:hypothetical protein [Hyunsoonleella aestuarii]|uniref:Polysaccharide chain length determinant N-terminal domain-containing protein n=1 Tax=Hyunsoonleella aestuarii TaxID=912802 RepID=A0ABP8E9G8_9FLAO|nr:hypothetical protein [Hyunsoonleella aestuarii]